MSTTQTTDTRMELARTAARTLAATTRGAEIAQSVREIDDLVGRFEGTRVVWPLEIAILAGRRDRRLRTSGY
jgi:hypothetical protein